MTTFFTHTIARLALLTLVFLGVAFLSAAPTQAFAAEEYNPKTAIFGPTIANVPWEFVPAWYKAELAALGYAPVVSMDSPEYNPKTAIFGPTIANVPWEFVPAWYKAELAAAAAPKATPGAYPSSSTKADEPVGKETAGGVAASVDLAAIDASDWGTSQGEEEKTTEAHMSFMTETGFFFLGVFLILLALFVGGILKRRTSDTAQTS